MNEGQQQYFKWKLDENGYLQYSFIYVKCPEKVNFYRGQWLQNLGSEKLTVNGEGGKKSDSAFFGL